MCDGSERSLEIKEVLDQAQNVRLGGGERVHLRPPARAYETMRDKPGAPF